MTHAVHQMHSSPVGAVTGTRTAAGTLVLTVIAVLLPWPLQAQAARVKAETRQDWTAMRDTIMKIADAMPADRFSYKPTPVQRSYGEQIVHIASANVSILKDVGPRPQPPTINMKATAKTEILKALGDSFDYGTAIIDAQTDEAMLQTVKTAFRVGESTRARIFSLLLNHTWDIYGQLAVYLRLNGFTPPASQQP